MGVALQMPLIAHRRLVAAAALALTAATLASAAPVVSVTPSVLAASGEPATVAWTGATSATYWDTIGVFANASSPEPIGFYVRARAGVAWLSVRRTACYSLKNS